MHKRSPLLPRRSWRRHCILFRYVALPWIIYFVSILCTMSEQFPPFIRFTTIIPYQPSQQNLSGAFAKPLHLTEPYCILHGVVAVQPPAYYVISNILNLIPFTVSVLVAPLKPPDTSNTRILVSLAVPYWR
jgi:hypothetical protein